MTGMFGTGQLVSGGPCSSPLFYKAFARRPSRMRQQASDLAVFARPYRENEALEVADAVKGGYASDDEPASKKKGITSAAHRSTSYKVWHASSLRRSISCVHFSLVCNVTGGAPANPFAMLGGGDDKEDDEPSIPQPVKKGKQKKGKQQQVASESESDDEPKVPQGGKKAKQAKKGKKQMSESEDESEDQALPQPVQKGKQAKKSKKHISESESEEEDAVPQPVKKGQQKAAKKQVGEISVVTRAIQSSIITTC